MTNGMTSGMTSGMTDDDAAAAIFDWTCRWALERELKLVALDETTSTNSLAKDDESLASRPQLEDVYAGHSEPSLYLARAQTSGRGRGDHTWKTPAGGALLSSWCFAIARVPQPIFSALVGLALFEAAKASWPDVEFNVKAPNDLFIGNKKTAGILIETVDQGVEKRTVIGVGFNASVKPRDVDTATCLQDHLAQPLKESDWQAFLEAWLVRLKDAVRGGAREKMAPEITERLRSALNLHPLLKEPILKVDELGQLYSASRVIYWHEL